MPVGVEASSTCEDQGVRLAPSKTAPDDEVPTIAHGPGLPRGVPAVRRGSGGLLAPVLRLPLGPSSLAGGERRPPLGDFGRGILAVSELRNILSRSRVADYFCHTLVPLDPYE